MFQKMENESGSLAITDKIAGAVYGQALGDAMGMPMELWSPEKVREFYGSPVVELLDGPAENEIGSHYKRGQFTDGRRVYLPYSCICSADAMVMHEHHACCSGHSVMNVPKVLVKYDGGQIFLSFTDEEVSKKVENFINEKVSAVIPEK